jgi:hypothetical protein
VAAAYQELRALRAQTGPMPPLQPDPPLPRTRVLSAHAFALRTRAPATQPLPQRTRAPSVQPLPPPTPPTRAPSTQPLPLRTREPSVQPLPPPTPPTRAPATQPLPPRAASSQPLPPRAGTSQPLPSRAGTSPGVGGSGVLGIRPGGPGANTPGVGGSGVLGIRPGGSGDDAPGAHLATGSSPDAIRASTPSGISHKALLHYRKAELSLRRGELKEAVLQLKLAVASDPQSAFLRTALAEVEAVVGK